MLSVLPVLVLWLAAFQVTGAGGLGEPYESERVHVRLRPPSGWYLADEEPLEFWQEGEYGPRIQVESFPYELSDPSDIEKAQEELSQALKKQFAALDIDHEKQLTHQGHPAIEVMATLTVGDSFYHVIQRCLFAKGRIYIITCASFEATFLEDLPVFRACLESVELLDNLFNPNIETTAPLIGRDQLGALAAGLALLGFILRRASLAKLKRVQSSL